MHCSQDSQLPYLEEKKVKNGSYGTIHTFKNDFATVFLVFSFQQNKLYPNRPYVSGFIHNDMDLSPGKSLDGGFRKSSSGLLRFLYLFLVKQLVVCNPPIYLVQIAMLVIFNL